MRYLNSKAKLNKKKLLLGLTKLLFWRFLGIFGRHWRFLLHFESGAKIAKNPKKRQNGAKRAKFAKNAKKRQKRQNYNFVCPRRNWLTFFYIVWPLNSEIFTLKKFWPFSLEAVFGG